MTFVALSSAAVRLFQPAPGSTPSSLPSVSAPCMGTGTLQWYQHTYFLSNLEQKQPGQYGAGILPHELLPNQRAHAATLLPMLAKVANKLQA